MLLRFSKLEDKSNSWLFWYDFTIFLELEFKNKKWKVVLIYLFNFFDYISFKMIFIFFNKKNLKIFFDNYINEIKC